MPGPHHYLLLPPRQTCGQGNLPSFEKEKEEKMMIRSLTTRYCLPVVGAAQSVRYMHAKKSGKHEIDKMCGAHELYLCTGSAPGFVQRITCNVGKTCTKGGCRNRFRQPRLTGKTYEDAQCSRSCSPECHLRSQGGQRQA